MKDHLKLGLLALAAALVLSSCASSDGGSQGDASQGNTKEQQEESGGMAGMDHESMGHGSGDMASGMLMQDGKYSDERFIDAMIPHHQSAIEMARVAREKSDVPQITGLAENIVSAQQAEIEQMEQWRGEWYPQD
jgi:uncharacterized protein (DUF305 family)